MAHIVAMISPKFEGVRTSDPAVEEEPRGREHSDLLALIRADENAETLLLEGTALPFRRYPYRWTLDGSSTQLSSVLLSEPRAVYVTDYAWSFRPAISAFPTVDGTYKYKWVWSIWRERWLPGGDAVFVYTLSGGGTQATLSLSVNGYYPTVLHSGGPLSSYSMTLGLLMSGGEMRTYDEEFLENWVAGTWSLTHDLNGVTGEDGKLDLRMLRTRNLAAVPRNFQPELGETTTIQADVMALPVATELFPEGWQPTGNLEWRIRAFSIGSYPYQLVGTFTGVAPVSPHDAEGKVAHFEHVWDGRDATGTAVSGPVSLPINAIAPVDTSGNARTRGGTNAALGPYVLEVTNLKAEPEEFTPDHGEVTLLSAQIIAENVTGMQSRVTVKDHNGSAVRHFPSRAGLSVREVWDGLTDTGQLAGVGTYTWEVSATSTEGVSHQASATVVLKPPLPSLSRIEFPQARSLLDAQGNVYRNPGVYYQEGRDGQVTHHPVLLTADLMASAATSIGVQTRRVNAGEGISVKFDFTLKRTRTAAEPAVYEVRVLDPEANLLVGPETLVFPEGPEVTVTVEFPFDLEPVVQALEFVKVEYRVPVLQEEWARDVHTLEDPIYVGLRDAVGPFEKGKNGKGPSDGLLDIACHLASGATDDSEVRDFALDNMCDWLTQKRFIYNSDASYVSLIDNREWSPSRGVRFEYGLFMLGFNDPGRFWQGSCEAVSALYALSCNALGVDMGVRRMTGARRRIRGLEYEFGLFHTQPIKACAIGVGDPNQFAKLPPPVFESWPFSLHQVAAMEGKVWDPTFLLGPGPTIEKTKGMDAATFLTRLLSPLSPAAEQHPETQIGEVVW
ncbi:MAG: hypothetical protein HY319_30590 [Armatimonadetes bacterium]|nr:hypothetical protein [Armatimonadota bacterium]